MRLEGKVAIVTGGGQGIGNTIAKVFAKEGANVVVADQDGQLAKDAAAEIMLSGLRSEAVQVDVSNNYDVDKMVTSTLAIFDRIDILVNNAGICQLTPTIEQSVDEWDRIIDVNLKGQFLCSQAVGRQMIKQKQGKIVNIASISGHVANPELAAYCASKAGVILLTKALAVEWAKYNINVNSVSPARTMTPLMEKLSEEAPEFIFEGTKRVPTGRANKPKDVANAVLFLASSEADNITGADLLVDGGACALSTTYIYPK